MKKNLAIVGLGRIGRTILKKAVLQDLEIKVISDKNPNIKNHSYLIKYDSTYGEFPKDVIAKKESIVIDGKNIAFQQSENISDLDLSEIDILIDATGSKSNEMQAKKVSEDNNLKIIITKSSTFADKEVVFGLNHNIIEESDKIISGSICDANALAHILNFLDSEYGIESGNFISLHPWLSYQNLVDSSLYSFSDPNIPWNEFSLGRSAVDSLIPKNTTAVDACEIILPNLKDKLSSFSYRTPLNTVTSGNLQVVITEEISKNDLYESLKQRFNDGKLFNFEQEDLVSIDFKATDYSLSLYSKSIKLKKKLISLSFWYDNEWAYSQRIIDIANIL